MRILDHPALKTKGIGYSKVHLARLEKVGKFPKHIDIGPNRIAWVEAEIDAWLEARVASRDAPDAAAPERPRGWKCQENPEPPRRRKDKQAEQPAAAASSPTPEQS
jgi:prophage regulatory protein